MRQSCRVFKAALDLAKAGLELLTLRPLSPKFCNFRQMLLSQLLGGIKDIE